MTYTDLTTVSQSQVSSLMHPAIASSCQYSGVPPMMVEPEPSYPMSIPRPVFSVPLSLSPSPSLDSLDSGTSSFTASPASCHSEADQATLGKHQ